jgi:hypothetical protein
MAKSPITKKELNDFDTQYDTTKQDRAFAERGRVIKQFPLARLKTLTLDEYVIGKTSDGGPPSFCTLIEPQSKAWAIIQGSTASKFGIYYGKTKEDSTKKYRFTKKFGTNQKEAFDAVKLALNNLIRSAKIMDYKEIDYNPLSQMFKAKILSLYFPEKFINICSGEHLTKIAECLELSDGSYLSEYQHLILTYKSSIAITETWSNPKFSGFLYAKFIRQDLEKAEDKKHKRKKTYKKVNMVDLAEMQRKIGEESEEYAHEWEKNRLIGEGFPILARKIKDRRDRPGYGYDYMSYDSPEVERYIEVKTAGKQSGGEYRFFLSENELATSIEKDNVDKYYFYIIIRDKDKIVDMKVIKAKDLYTNFSEPVACAFKIYFDPKDIT